MLLLLVGSALAQVLPREPLDVERFKPALSYDAFVVTEGSAVRDPFPADAFQLGFVTNGAVNPLVVVDAKGAIVSRFVSSRIGGELYASGTVAGPLSLAVGLPFFAAQSGDYDPRPSGIGDARLVPKVRLLDDRAAPLGLAVIGELRLPTHSDDEFSGGARALAFAPKLAADRRLGGGFRVGANAGLLLRRETTFENVEAGSELTYSAAASYHPGGYDSRLGLGVDLHGGAGLGSLELEEAPLEGQLYATFRPRPDVEVLGGPALGLVPGYGTPTFRAFVGVRFAPTAHDSDWDGITDASDRCPDKAEVRNRVDDRDGCPDHADRYPATVIVRGADRAPLDGVPVKVTVDGDPKTMKGGVAENLPPGRWPVTIEVAGYQPRQAVLIVAPDGQNVLDVRLKPVGRPATVSITIVGPDGQPLPKASARVDDAKAAVGPEPGRLDVEVAPGEHVLWVRAKGYVPQRIEIEVAPGRHLARKVVLQPIAIEVTDQRLKLSGTVYFDTGSAHIVEESYDLLDEVAAVLQANPSIRKMHVEGHTDSRGSEVFNQQLSEARAKSVVAYLVSKGVDPGRLEAHGYGESRPISSVHDENRRVDFVIVKGKLTEEP